MVPTRIPHRIVELPDAIPADEYFGIDLTFDDRLLLTYEAGKEACLDELIDGSWHPRFRADTSKLSWHFAQLYLDETLLLVNSRTRGPQEPNAIVIEPSGRELDRWYLGDGIEHCQVDATGNTWGGYFDEGVFGDQNLGHQGLIKFDCHARPAFQFQRDAIAVPPIYDCYALNVTGRDEAWLCYYDAFPLVRVRADKPELISKETPVAGSKAVVLDRNQQHCAFWSGYNKDSRVHVLNLETMECTKIPLRAEDGKKFPRWVRAARGSRLILDHGRSLYEFDLNTDL